MYRRRRGQNRLRPIHRSHPRAGRPHGNRLGNRVTRTFRISPALICLLRAPVAEGEATTAFGAALPFASAGSSNRQTALFLISPEARSSRTQNFATFRRLAKQYTDSSGPEITRAKEARNGHSFSTLRNPNCRGALLAGVITQILLPLTRSFVW